MATLEGMLLNVFILIFFLLFIPIFFNRIFKAKFRKYKKLILLLNTSLCVIACISFPIYFSDGYIYDLRYVAVVIGGLYGGVSVSIFIWVVTIAFRALSGGMGVYSTIMFSTVILLFTLLWTRSFRASTKSRKIMIGCSISFLFSLLVVSLSIITFDLPLNLPIDMIFILFQTFATGLVIYILEISRETHRLNKEMIIVEKMEVVSHLASSISHEVRNPLAVVRGFLQMMEDDNITVEKRKEFIHISIQEIDRANDIIQNYLTFAKPSLENMVIMDVGKELQRAIDIIFPYANMNCVEIESTIESCFIKGEVHLFQQCLLNIMKSCIEAMPESGKLIINASEQLGTVVIKIIDNGIEMSEEQLLRLGEPYYTTKGRKGTGLGIMAALQIIEMMNGSHNVTSKVNEGTHFSLYFPVAILNSKIKA